MSDDLAESLDRYRALRAELAAQPEPLVLAWGDVRRLPSGLLAFEARGLVPVDGGDVDPPRRRSEDPERARAQAERLRLALVLDADSLDGWRLVDLVPAP